MMDGSKVREGGASGEESKATNVRVRVLLTGFGMMLFLFFFEADFSACDGNVCSNLHAALRKVRPRLGFFDGS